jgi:arsenate reductase
MKIVFLCVANSARSQMAEGLARAMAKPGIEIMSAGSLPSHVNPFAILALQELSIDISHHTSKNVSELNLSDVTYVITLCADEVCPVFIGTAEKLHWPFTDPAGVGQSDEEKLAAFRAIRNQIQEKLKIWLDKNGLLNPDFNSTNVR